MIETIGILGGGAWGTALALVAARAGRDGQDGGTFVVFATEQELGAEGLVVGDEGGVFVVHAGGHIAPMRRRERFAGGGFEIHDVERVLRIGNNRSSLLRK